jgi:hypothetical protein
MERRTALTALLASLFLLGTAYVALGERRGELHISVDGEEALRLVMENEEAKGFIEEHLTNESGRITRVALRWDPETGSYRWEVEIMERECGCVIGGLEGLSVLNAEVDPVTGEVSRLRMRTGVKEESLAKERCMEGCHPSDERLDRLKIAP